MFPEITTEDQIAEVAALAREIWTGHYTPIIGSAQVEYMLDRFQSPAAIAGQIRTGCRYFLIKDGPRSVGYLAVQPKGDELFLSKIYVLAAMRRKGFGKKAVGFAESLARENGFRKITLTVNKFNNGTIRVYEKIGFKNLGSVIQDIGNGFVMDDYKMEKIV